MNLMVSSDLTIITNFDWRMGAADANGFPSLYKQAQADSAVQLILYKSVVVRYTSMAEHLFQKTASLKFQRCCRFAAYFPKNPIHFCLLRKKTTLDHKYKQRWKIAHLGGASLPPC